MQVKPYREYKKLITDICNIRAIIPLNQSKHPHVMYPFDISFDGHNSYLHYHVSDDGMTLREFIDFIYNPRKKLRATIFNTLHRVRPIDIILQLVDAYEFMLEKNMLVGQSNVNPDCIWVDRTVSGDITVFVLDTLETVIDNKYRIVDDNNQYWSAEYISEYSNLMFYNSDSIRKPTLTRCDTKPTPISIVYSLGLILYFIVEHHDPYPDGRLHSNERPLFRAQLNERYKKCVSLATEPDIRKRPTMREWKDMIQVSDNKTCFVM